MDAAAVVRTLGLPLRALPAVLLVAFAGLVGLVALVCPADRRDYAAELVRTWTLAACMIMTGQRMSLPRRDRSG